MTTIGVAAERDLLNQIPSLPRVYDGACLTWLMYAGAATPMTSDTADPRGSSCSDKWVAETRDTED